MPSVTEQLVYEMGDPHAYITPDVVADFTSIRLEQDGENRVRVFGISGRPATDKLKVSDRLSRRIQGGRNARLFVARRAAERRSSPTACFASDSKNLGLEFDHILTEFVGVSATHGRLAGEPGDPPEVQLRVGVRGTDKASVERFTREIAPLVLNGPPSVTGFAGGRPKVEEIVAYWPALIDKTVVHDRGRGAHMKVRLLDIAHARSGDKGDTANVGVIALDPAWYPVLERYLTVDRVREHFAASSPATSSATSCRISGRSTFCCTARSTVAERSRSKPMRRARCFPPRSCGS